MSKDERIVLLEQLQSGNISVEDALRLMDASEDAPHSNGQRPEQQPHSADPRTADDFFTTEHTDDTVAGWLGRTVYDLGNAIREWDVTTEVTDFFTGQFAHHKQHRVFASQPIKGGVIHSLTLPAKNANVTVRSYDGDCVQLQCKYDARGAEGVVHFYDDGAGHIGLQYNPKLVRHMEIMCGVPHMLIENLVIHNKNAKISVEDVWAHVATLQTTNAKIEIQHSDIQHLTLKTTNTAIKYNACDFYVPTNAPSIEKNERTLNLHTTNSGITVWLPQYVGLALQAMTTNAKIKYDSPNPMQFEEYTPTYMKGFSPHYESQDRQLLVNVKTTNGKIRLR